MPICSKCKQDKSVEKFSKSCRTSTGLQRYCKKCSSKATSLHYEANKEYYIRKAKDPELVQYVNRLKSVPCRDCGNRYPPHAMDFDHVRGVKVANISSLLRSGTSKFQLQEEIDKCEVVCSNCHRIRTKHRPRAPRAIKASSPRFSVRPSAQILSVLIDAIPASEIGKLYAVSGSLVKRWCTQFGLQSKPRGYWTRVNVESGKFVPPVPVRSELIHGVRGYRRGCRCEICKSEFRVYARVQSRRRRGTDPSKYRIQ